MKFYQEYETPGLWVYPICESPLYTDENGVVYFCFEYKDDELGTGLWSLDFTESTKEISGLEHDMIRALYTWDYEL